MVGESVDADDLLTKGCFAGEKIVAGIEALRRDSGCAVLIAVAGGMMRGKMIDVGPTKPSGGLQGLPGGLASALFLIQPHTPKPLGVPV